jgi:hypothetical protein
MYFQYLLYKIPGEIPMEFSSSTPYPGMLEENDNAEAAAALSFQARRLAAKDITVDYSIKVEEAKAAALATSVWLRSGR